MRAQVPSPPLGWLRMIKPDIVSSFTSMQSSLKAFLNCIFHLEVALPSWPYWGYCLQYPFGWGGWGGLRREFCFADKTEYICKHSWVGREECLGVCIICVPFPIYCFSASSLVIMDTALTCLCMHNKIRAQQNVTGVLQKAMYQGNLIFQSRIIEGNAFLQ